jgi:hypothetical protein
MMKTIKAHENPLGMKAVFEEVRCGFPQMRHGYFNPPKEKFSDPYQ